MLFQLPSFIRNVVAISTGAVNQATRTVRLAPTARQVTVTLRRAP